MKKPGTLYSAEEPVSTLVLVIARLELDKLRSRTLGLYLTEDGWRLQWVTMRLARWIEAR